MTESVTQRVILLVGHGTIEHSSDVPEFLRRIRRGRPASDEFVSEIRRRYDHIGGSPLLKSTTELAAQVSACTNVPTRVAMRYWDPLIADVLRELARSGVKELCVLPVAPFSVHVYAAAVEEALQALRSEDTPEVAVRTVRAYGDHPELVSAHAEAIAPFLSGKRPGETELVLTAHSLPSRVIGMGDPYEREFAKSAAAVSARLSYPFTLAYQSQGEGNDEWLGPTLLQVLEAAKARGVREVVVVPVGFLADHVETLYDLDVEAAGQARALGLAFHRVPSLGTAPGLVTTLAALYREAFQ
jgi:ferrochelatase